MRTLLAEHLQGETRLAVVEDGSLAEIYVERPGTQRLTGNIYAGRVENVLPGMNAAFVDIGLDKNAFLHADEMPALGDDELKKHLAKNAQKAFVKKGQMVIVQVVKEAGGEKGPVVTCNISIAGRLMVLLADTDYIGISRKITLPARREELRGYAQAACEGKTSGMILRTKAKDACAENIAHEYSALDKEWQNIKKIGLHAQKPMLLRREDGVLFRAVRDMLDDDTQKIIAEDEVSFEQFKTALEMFTPEFSGKLSKNSGEIPVFDVYRVDDQLKDALSRRVWLKSGGFLVFDSTEAFTVVDVNTGKFVGKRNQEETILKLNMEAAREIARQLRLRDVGGIIVIDFIDMKTTQARKALLDEFKKALYNDRTHTGVVGMTQLGLVEMTRKRSSFSLSQRLNHTCTACGGTGFVPGHETLARQIIRALWRNAKDGAGRFAVTASPAVAGWLMNIGAPEGVDAWVISQMQGADSDYAIDRIGAEIPANARKI